MAHLDYDHLNSLQRYAQWAVFAVQPGALADDRSEIIVEAEKFFADLAAAGRVTVRGTYLTSGIQPDGDFIIWWHAEEYSELQDALNDFRRSTVLGQIAELTWVGNALHRPAEFNKSHLPSFIMGEDPQDWLTLYPFVRSYDWYLLDPKERRTILSEHGQAARDFADVRANTLEAFALGDYEWMLCFEAPKLERIVDLMHKMRYTKARLHVREEVPFYSGRRLAIGELIVKLP